MNSVLRSLGCRVNILQHLRVMVTRPDSPRDPLAEQLRQRGADVILQPMIRILPPTDWQPVDAALARLDQFDWLVFSSANGVRYLLDRLMQHGDLGRLHGVKLAAIGPGTADELVRYELHTDLVPDQYRADALAEALACVAGGRRFLLARASRGREVLAEQLMAAGAIVEQIVVYQSIDVGQPDPSVAALLRAGRIDWITVTSSAIARSLVHLFGEDLHRAKLASISPITSGVLREQGYEPAVEAADYTMPGLVKAIAEARLGL
jgi:uroporphyrinogen III methyltransferase / synthase